VPLAVGQPQRGGAVDLNARGELGLLPPPFYEGGISVLVWSIEP